MRKTLLTATSLLALTLIACSEPSTKTSPEKATSDMQNAETLKVEMPSVEMPAIDNVLLAEFKGPYGGVPAFDKMDLAALKPALEWGMEKNLKEVDAIANNPAAPTFENTILPMEKAGAELDRAFRYWGIWSSNMSSPEFRTIQGEMAPKISEFRSKITQNEKLFNRVKAVYESDAVKNMRPDQQRLVQLTYDGFARNGATLNAEDKARYAAINKRLSELHTKFANNVLQMRKAIFFTSMKTNLAVYLTAILKPQPQQPPPMTKMDNMRLRIRVHPCHPSSPILMSGICARKCGRPIIHAAIMEMSMITMPSSLKF